MTHAALKDRKTHVEVLTELRNDVNPEGADPYGHMIAEALDAAIAALSAVEGEAHPDDLAVDRFATAMKAKMAKQRAKGYGGWDDPADCTANFLRERLLAHVGKGDPVDVGNFAMMLWNRSESTAPPPQQAGKDFEFGGYCGTCGSPCDDQGRSIHGHASTQPQQAGGDAVVPEVPFGKERECPPEFRESEMTAEEKTAKIRELQAKLAKACRDEATPPQPEAGGGVTEVMVETLFRVLDDPFNQWHTRNDRGRAALAAALSTTPASGGEHEKES